MAHESFEDPGTAALMNASFVCVKVDREERPDVDAVYMTATQAMTGQGGWPMTVFATPDGRPFHCGTYFPPEPRHGMPSFRQVCEAVTHAWRTDRARVDEGSARVAERLAAVGAAAAPEGATPPGGDELAAAVRRLAEDYDAARGGFGGAPKFPPSMTIEQLLRHHARTGDAAALAMARGTCEAMARGGIFDQVGGGFARYSVDAGWVVPHFEKMLYDNAQLLRVYTHLWQTTREGFMARIAVMTAEWLVREMRTPEGGFASSLDADSEGREGAFYVWTPEQLAAALGPDDGARAVEIFGVTPTGTFEAGASVMRLPVNPPDDEEYIRLLRALLAARVRRVRPGRDDKVVAGWNGLAIGALAEFGVEFELPEYVDAAVAAAAYLLDTHLVDGRLRRTSRQGAVGANAGVLEDYGCVAEGLLTLYGVTGERRWFTAAGGLLDVVLARFTDAEGRFHDTADDAETLLFRPADPSDNASPSGTSAAAGALLTYAAYTGSARHRAAAERALAVVGPLAARAPRFAGWSLAVAEALADGPREVAIVGPAGGELHRTALTATAPGLVIAVGEPGAEPSSELLRDRTPLDGLPAAYVCRGFVCDLPTTDPAALAERLRLAEAVAE